MKFNRIKKKNILQMQKKMVTEEYMNFSFALNNKFKEVCTVDIINHMNQLFYQRRRQWKSDTKYAKY